MSKLRVNVQIHKIERVACHEARESSFKMLSFDELMQMTMHLPRGTTVKQMRDLACHIAEVFDVPYEP